uniref:EGF-like domain-containing protein n=1 Tax=Brassica oleracea var. oleracea TaxID=109376 RepID=A0A0D3DQR4_BRAOL
MNFRGNIPTKFSLGIFRGDFRQTSDPRNFLGNLFPRNSVGKFREISEERRNSEELFPRTCFVDINECISTIHKHNCSDPSTCRNKDGGFYCKCRSGYRLDTNTMSCKRKDFGWAAILLGTTIGFLSIMPAVSCVRQKMKHRKDSQLRQKFFVQNGGGLLVQRLSGEET